jgi:hypothetical protein
MSFMHLRLVGEEQADKASVGLVRHTSGLIVGCEAMIRSFVDRHPVHVLRAPPILHHPSCSLILPVIGESDA